MNKNILIILLCFLCLGCNSKNGDSIALNKEEEKYNDKYIKLDIDEDNIIKYSDVDSVNKIIKSGSGVIFIGNPRDDISRRAIDILFKVSDSTDLDKIYYIDGLDGILGLDNIKDIKVPVVLFVLKGDIVRYQVGIIGDSVDMSHDDEMKLYNNYLEGIHDVLEDTCDEEC